MHGWPTVWFDQVHQSVRVEPFGSAHRERITWAFPALLALLMTQCAVVPRVAHAQAAQATPPYSSGNGKMIFESRCIACHSLDTNRIGPALQGVVGRVAGKAPDFAYSKALGAATHRWERDKLLAWLTNPEAVVPGQGMGYSVEKAEDRRDVVAYLATVSLSVPVPAPKK